MKLLVYQVHHKSFSTQTMTDKSDLDLIAHPHVRFTSPHPTVNSLPPLYISDSPYKRGDVHLCIPFQPDSLPVAPLLAPISPPSWVVPSEISHEHIVSGLPRGLCQPAFRPMQDPGHCIIQYAMLEVDYMRGILTCKPVQGENIAIRG